MISSKDRLKEDIAAVLEAIRQEGRGRYACVVDVRAIVFEAPEPTDGAGAALHRLIFEGREDIFAIPRALAEETEPPDAFGGWDEDEFFLAVVNERVAVVVACPKAEPLRQSAMPHLEIIADRLLRYEERYRVDRQGRGLFFGRPKLDLIVVE